MDLFTPADQRPVHFMGIGGAGMSALALIACRRGVRVSGCDVDPSGAADLADLGVHIFQGHNPAHLDGVRAVVVTAAVPADHPELARARELGLPVVPRKEALAALVAAGRSVAVSGTHGKTTTTVMTTEALTAAGLDPTGIAGGRVAAWRGNARVAGDEVYVVEADEFDQAFLTLQPTIAVVNNVEPDHLECYGSIEALESAFVEFAGRAEVAVVSADDPGARRVAARLRTRVVSFGLGDGAALRATDVAQEPDGTRATIRGSSRGELPIRLRVPGLHNLRNALGALGVVDAMGGDVARAAEALAEFRGVGRRFERVGEFAGIEIVDDYAHHPSELEATLAAARQAYPGRRLVAVFQPHLYSRTAAHGEAMGRALAAADLAVVADVYAAREQPMPGVSGRQVADAARAAGGDAVYQESRPALAPTVRDLARSGDVVLTLGAGDVTRVGRELAALLERR